jgi:hypothetical protein
MKIHCFGNSHINNFSNSDALSFESKNDLFVLYHLGPTIAYNFYEHHFQKVLENLHNIDKENDYITLVLGEVDCRLHLPKQADLQGKSDEELVEECVDRLFKCYKELKELGYNCLVYSTHPTTSKEYPELSEYIYDHHERRNHICVLWNLCVKKNTL